MTQALLRPVLSAEHLTGLAPTPCVLAVDDDRTMLGMLEFMLQKLGYEVLTANSGEEALSILAQERGRICTVLLDREMPGIHGMEVVRRMKASKKLRSIPIIMQTGSGRPEQIEEGLQAGVFYYLLKPLQERILGAVTAAAVHEAQQFMLLEGQMERHQESVELLESARFLFRSLKDAESLASFLAHCFPSPGRVLQGLAELMVNAVEHGNLGIGYDEKTQLLVENRWRDEINRRLALPSFSERKAEVIVKRNPDGVYVQITDQGKGFEWQKYLTIDPARATENHGRGIARANLLSFDRMHYQGNGNQVIGIVYTDGRKTTKSVEW